MTLHDLVGTGLAAVKPQKSPAVEPPNKPAAVPDPRLALWWRIALLGALFCGAYGALVVRVVTDSVAGSPTAYLVVAPLLVALSMTGFRTPPRGVGDSESDWIIAVGTGVVGFSAIALVTSRFPTLAGLWRLELVGALLWVICTGIIIFSVRHVVRMWQVWVFAFMCATTVPYLLVTAALGGSETADSTISVALGTVAVYLAARPMRRRWRIVAALSTFALGVAVALSVQIGLFATVVLAGGVVPLSVTLGLHLFSTYAGEQRRAPVYAEFHRLSPRSLVLLVLLAVLLLATHTAMPSRPDPPLVSSDWTTRAGLATPEQFGFISRFVGSDSTLLRYTVPNIADLPAAAVDVISTPNLAALQVYSDAVLYPSPTPVNMVPFDRGPEQTLPLTVKAMYSNADAATDDSAENWFALTWIWKVVAAYQQVTVVINQSARSSNGPANPVPPSAADTIAEPILWVARQQPESEGHVDKRVVARAEDIMGALIIAADPARGSNEPNRD